MQESVAPYTGAWIEIIAEVDTHKIWDESHPTRVRGLKFLRLQSNSCLFIVAPYTGAWIEILRFVCFACFNNVAPYTGAWIEINQTIHQNRNNTVAPYTGAWIEILVTTSKSFVHLCRTLHGCVD